MANPKPVLAEAAEKVSEFFSRKHKNLLFAEDTNSISDIVLYLLDVILFRQYRRRGKSFEKLVEVYTAFELNKQNMKKEFSQEASIEVGELLGVSHRLKHDPQVANDIKRLGQVPFYEIVGLGPLEPKVEVGSLLQLKEQYLRREHSLEREEHSNNVHPPKEKKSGRPNSKPDRG